MIRDAVLILRILAEHGALPVYNVDRWFVSKGGEGFGPEILSDLVQQGFVVKSEGRYELSASGRDALEREAA